MAGLPSSSSPKAYNGSGPLFLRIAEYHWSWQPNSRRVNQLATDCECQPAAHVNTPRVADLMERNVRSRTG